MKQIIAFFWVGSDVTIPSALVDSIRLTMADTVDIIQLTDKKTPLVPHCDKAQRFTLSKQIMIARLQAYSKYNFTSGLTFFCDADCIFINPLNVNLYSDRILLTPRLEDFLINDKYPEFYPEFTGKTINQVMPFLFSAIATIGNQSKTFDRLLKICKALPERFHRWYGDQYSLFLAAHNKEMNFGYLEPAKHHHVTKETITNEHLRQLKDEGVQMIHFKGSRSKQHLFSTLENLKSLK